MFMAPLLKLRHFMLKYLFCYQGGDTIYMETAVIHWTVNNRVLQSSPRMQLTTAVLHAELQGRLVIDKTLALDSGNYSCLPSYATPDWVMVHIVTGQNTRPAGVYILRQVGV